MNDTADTVYVAGVVLAILLPVAAWITHVVWVINKILGTAPVTGGEMAIGVIGAFLPPIGAIHGFIIWFT